MISNDNQLNIKLNYNYLFIILNDNKSNIQLKSIKLHLLIN